MTPDDSMAWPHADFRRSALFGIGDLFGVVAEARTHDLAVSVDERQSTYGEMRDRATTLARSLIAIGIDRGDRIGVLMHNSVECVEVFLAAAMVGAPIVPINTRLQDREIAYVLRTAGVQVLLTSDAPSTNRVLADRLTTALPQLMEASAPQDLRLDGAPMLRVVSSAEDLPLLGMLPRSEFDALSSTVQPAEVERRQNTVRARDPYVIFFTSGTTADPKGCVLTHEAVLRASLHTSERFDCQPGENIWCPLPMFHTGFVQMFGAALWIGGGYFSTAFFDPGAAIEQIQRGRVAAMFPAFPLIMQGILNHPDYGPDSLSTVRTAFNVGPADSLADMQRRMPHTTLISGYGMTEFAGSIAITARSDDLRTRLTTQGEPFPGVEVEIRDSDGHPCAPGVTGEIVARGPTLFEHYFGDEATTAASMTEDGFFVTGDLGTLDEAGRLTYRGRLKDMLKVGGENVAAIEVESFLATHPAVSVAAVVGMPDATYVEVPVAFVELRPGSTVAETELIQFCQSGLARFKVPRLIRVVDEWPMSATKIQKHRLLEELLAERTAQSNSMNGGDQ
jgi:fatty-acyl-CoA synthase